MIAANDIYKAPADVWARLSAPLSTEAISWRQDGKPINRDGRILARFVAYVEANTVRERLDEIVPGEWDLTLTPLPQIAGEPAGEATCSFKARLQILGVVREDVGTGRDYKQAATDAFKRAAFVLESRTSSTLTDRTGSSSMATAAMQSPLKILRLHTRERQRPRALQKQTHRSHRQSPHGHSTRKAAPSAADGCGTIASPIEIHEHLTSNAATAPAMA
jgi:Uncharacterized protein conserved in bacteria